MVASATKRTYLLTAGVATATLLVAATVLVGPTLVNCYTSADGFGACLRQQVVDVGLLPAEEVPPVVVAAPEGEPAPPVETAPAEAPPAETAATPEAAPSTEVAAAAAVQPALDLLRAEPDGSLVIAGSGAPGAEVEIYADGELLGTTTTEDSGDWVVVPDQLLPPGGVEITVGTPGNDLRSERSFVVVIDEDKQAEPLIVATAPGEASRILQGLTAPEPAPEPVPVSEPVPASDPEAALEQEPALEADELETTVAEPEAEEVDTTAVPDSTIQTASEPDVVPPAAETRQDVALAEPTPPAAAEPADSEDTAATAAESELQQPEPDTELALATPQEPLPAVPEVPPVTVPPSIDAVEIDGNINFFAGGGTEGATVRLYVDDRFIADTVVDGGRWLVEAEGALTKPEQRVRIDMLEPGSASVAARAEVDFVVAPPAEPVAETSVATASEPAAVPDAEVASAPARESVVAADPEPPVTPRPDAAAPIATAAPEIAPEPDVETMPASEAEPMVAATPAPEIIPAPEIAPEPEVVAIPEPAPVLPEADTKPTETALAPAPDDSTATPQDAQAERLPSAPDLPMAGSPAEPATAATPVPPAAPATPVTAAVDQGGESEDAVPTLTARQVGDPEENRFVSGTAIIRRGDNLWSIARRVYGEGIRYTTIYRANEGQIRDPDLIYPGQVFDLPSEADG